ncbi:MAG: hypothetical protein J7501_02810 [Bdellovibrio sp.]|nr:hypothetical protein [Bdellovibrio sp.]
MRFLQFLLVLFIPSLLWASSADERPIRSDYQRVQLWEQVMSGGLPRPLPDDPAQPPQDPSPAPPPPYCVAGDPLSNSCVRAVCDQLPNLNCMDPKKVRDIACQCQGVAGDCVTAVCNQLNRFDCDEKRELYLVVNMCRGVSDASCINTVCSSLGRFDCDDFNDMKKVTDLCRR